MRTAVLLLLVISILVLPACQMNERLSGTVFGALGGAGIGALAGGWGGAAVGLVAGGVAGYLVGDYLSDKRECGRCGIFPPSKCGPPACEPQCAPQYTPPCTPAPCAYTPPVAQCAPAVRGVKDYPINPAARAAYQQGRAALSAATARGHFEQSIRLDPRRAEPYNALGLNYLYAGDRVGAERLFRQSLQLDPDYYAAKYNLERLMGKVTAAR